MTVRVAINGFGRIGRLVARAIIESKHTDMELVAINDPGGNFFPLLKYDSIHGRAPFDVRRDGDDTIMIDDMPVHRFRSRDRKNSIGAVKVPTSSLNAPENSTTAKARKSTSIAAPRKS